MAADELVDVMQLLSKRKDVRSADQASLKRMLVQMRHGEALSYQERQQLWALINRYEPNNRVQVPR